jgi:hypothetical protein
VRARPNDMPIHIFCCWLIAIAAAIGCGGRTSTPPPSPTGPTGALQVAGTYQISQTAVDDTCGVSSAPISFTGTVAHTAGGTIFTLTDTVGTNFNGTVERDGNFTAMATVGPDSGGQTYSERLEGRFTATGFSATLRVDVSPRNCRFTRSWTAAKQGAPNVIP